MDSLWDEVLNELTSLGIEGLLEDEALDEVLATSEDDLLDALLEEVSGGDGAETPVFPAPVIDTAELPMEESDDAAMGAQPSDSGMETPVAGTDKPAPEEEAEAKVIDEAPQEADPSIDAPAPEEEAEAMVIDEAPQEADPSIDAPVTVEAPPLSTEADLDEPDGAPVCAEPIPDAGTHGETPPVPVAPEQGLPAPEADQSGVPGSETAHEGAHSPFEDVVDDELVRSLLEEGLVEVPQVRAAVRSRKGNIPLWRMLVVQNGVDSDAVFGAVARKEGFRTTRVDAEHPANEFVLEVLELFPREVGARMIQMGLLPVEVKVSPENGRYYLVVATHDLLREEVRSFLEELDLDVELRFAPSGQVTPRIKEITALLRGTVSQPAPPPEVPAMPEEAPPAVVEIRDEEDWMMPAATEEVLDRSTSEAPSPSSDATESTVEPPSPAPAAHAEPEDEDASFKSKDRVVSALLWKRLVTPKQVARAVQVQKEEDSREVLWRILAGIEGVDTEVVYEEAARVYAFPVADLADGKPDAEFVMLIMETVAEDRREDLLNLSVLPYEYDIDPQNSAARLIFISHDPARPEVHRILQSLNLGRFELQYAPRSVILKKVEEIFPRKNEYLERITEEPVAFDLGTSYEDNKKGELIDEEALEAEISRSSLINLFEATLVEAVRQGVSDIHIYPNPDRKIEIHFRIDGRLKKWFTEDKVHPESFLAVVKDNSINVDRFERDAAQDGFIQRWIDGALIRFRVSVLPIASAAQEVRAESIVIRVLDDRKVLTDLRKLGMLDVALERFDRAIRQPYGMVILTGPTGSGKSTTLVAALHQVVTPDVNVLTVEDPVEYIIKGVRQIKLNNKLGLQEAIRAILRHDPDVVMVGEMRDRPTAELAIKLANTGHLTFSTLHTNDAPSAVSRLYKMGIEPFLIAYAINLVVAQRLIRRLCPDCKQVDPDPDPVLLEQLGFSADEVANTTFYTSGHRANCPTCNGRGYKGRRAICETLYFTREIRHMIVESGEKVDEEQIRRQAIADGMLTLQDSARELVKMGDTSVEEMMRVTATEG